MPIRNRGEGGTGVKCMFIFLFAFSVLFIIDSSLYIQQQKNEDAMLGYDKNAVSISCQIKILTWISISFFNFYSFIFFIIYILILSSPRNDYPHVKTKRFKIVIFMTFIFIPFMFSWNLYGHFTIKQEYFKIQNYKQAYNQNIKNN